jgi:hypothetical protein
MDFIFLAVQYQISTIIQPPLFFCCGSTPASSQLGYGITVDTVIVVVTKRIILKCNEPYDQQSKQRRWWKHCDPWRLLSTPYFYTSTATF